MTTRLSWRRSRCAAAMAALLPFFFPLAASAATVVDLAVGQVTPVGRLMNGACNTVEVRIRNASSNNQVETGRVELYVLDAATKKTLWRHAGLTVRGIRAGRTETFTFSKVDVSVPQLVSSLSVAFQARIFTNGWYRSVDNNSRNNQYLSAPGTVRASDKCGGGGGGGGTEGDPAPSIAAFREAASVFRHARCTTCHTAATMPSAPHPTVLRGRPIGAQDCATCHHFPSSANPVPSSGIGAPVPRPNSNRAWRMAPAAMRLAANMSDGAICRQVRGQSPGSTDADRARAAADHVEVDDLVKWAFQPRCAAGTPGTASTSDGPCSSLQAAPGSHFQLVQLLETWADNGGFCPP